jgi:hypothetical protein
MTNPVTVKSAMQLAVSASVLVSLLYLVNRGASALSPAPVVAEAVPAIPMIGIPGVTSDTRATMLPMPKGENNSDVPNANIGDANGLLFNEQSLAVQLAPMVPEWIANIVAVS